MVQKDFKEAVRWYRKAAEQGDAGAQYNLGNYIADGRGVAQDHKVAVEWFRKAADQQDPHAQNNLGFVYKKGEGVPLDNIEAHKWYTIAAANGNSDEGKGRDELAKKMTPTQIAEAENRAREWKPTLTEKK
ncbi:MAG: TPR repeat protein [Candidatus Binatia bacterium]|jgi:TPR repeat protein